MYSSKIAAVGHYTPEKTVTNNHLSKIMNTSDEWISERTGIKERHYMTEGVDTTSNMGTKAARIALERANLKPEDIDLIVFATLSPDYYFPGSGVLTLRELGLKNTPTLDIRQQCAGFIYGLSVADQFIKTGMYKNILLIGSEIQSKLLEHSDRGRNVSVLFGDGAGAVILTQSNDDSKILSTHLHADGTDAEQLALENPGTAKSGYWITEEMVKDGSLLPHMNGQNVFKTAVTKFPEVIKEALDANNFTPQDLNLLIPHQANLRIAEFVQKRLGLRDDQVFNNIQKYGNTTAASIPIALSEAWEQGKVNKNDLICLAAFGSGFVWASALLRW
ncbi:ketoacyl-ACP synthase III [Cyclobacteriaceae bacterium]|nr:ketoacyl-ACP synthase III [Cyclobacteriaceae bacterium]